MSFFDRWFKKEQAQRPPNEGKEKPPADAGVLADGKRVAFTQAERAADSGSKRLPLRAPGEKTPLTEEVLERALRQLKGVLSEASNKLASNIETAQQDAIRLALVSDAELHSKIMNFAQGGANKRQPSVDELRAKSVRDAQEGITRMEQRRLALMEALEILDQENSPAGAAAVLDERIRNLQEEIPESASKADLEKRLARLKIVRNEIEDRMRYILPEIWNKPTPDPKSHS